jgi:hypothetical protein
MNLEGHRVVSGWGGTRATQIIDADHVLDRFDGAKTSFVIDPHSVLVLGRASRPRCEPLPTSIAVSRLSLDQDLEDVQCRRRSWIEDHLHIACDARAGVAEEQHKGLPCPSSPRMSAHSISSAASSSKFLLQPSLLINSTSLLIRSSNRVSGGMSGSDLRSTRQGSPQQCQLL